MDIVGTFLFVVSPLAFLYGLILIFTEKGKLRTRGLILVQASIIGLLIRYSVCSGI